MDTKSKSNKQDKRKKRAARALGLGIVMALVGAFLLCAWSLCYLPALEQNTAPFEGEAPPETMLQYTMVMYSSLKIQQGSSAASPAGHLLFPSAYGLQGNNSAAQQYNSFIDEVNSTFSAWHTEFAANAANYTYLAYDNNTGDFWGSAGTAWPTLLSEADGTLPEEDLQGEYRMCLVMSFDKTGKRNVEYAHGLSAGQISTLEKLDIGDWFPQREELELGGKVRQISLPSNMVFVLAVSRQTLIATAGYSEYAQLLPAFAQGLLPYYCAAMVLSLLAGLFAALAKRSGVCGLAVAKMPLEGALLACGAAAGIYALFVPGDVLQFFGGASQRLLLSYGLPKALAAPMSWVYILAVLLAFFGLVYCAGASLAQLRELGPRAYFASKSLFVKLGAITWRWLLHLDLGDGNTRFPLRIVAACFVLICPLFLLGLYGILPLALLAVIVFVFIRRYFVSLKKGYRGLLGAADKMAQGNLYADIPGELGPMQDIGEKLADVQAGFQHAVDAETKSQRTKSELITNVSHDLKTPLTAIITYVDLLKKPDITPEERESYIQTLDMKSQRLKRLIEDLFEMSKATSRDITLDLVPVDIASLLRQVELETRDDLAAAHIEMRYEFPPEKLLVPLDSEKAYRVFENLLLNIAKYGMPGTRAYVTAREDGEMLRVEVKNVSREEMTFDAATITERFTRGDASRSTEGSGLGLAIAKSFVEAHGGSFYVHVDGDVFKAIVLLPCPRQTQEALPPAPYN